jgi:phage gpG-like protein
MFDIRAKDNTGDYLEMIGLSRRVATSLNNALYKHCGSFELPKTPVWRRVYAWHEGRTLENSMRSLLRGQGDLLSTLSPPTLDASPERVTFCSQDEKVKYAA